MEPIRTILPRVLSGFPTSRPWCDNGLHDRRELWHVEYLDRSTALLCRRCFQAQMRTDPRQFRGWQKVVDLTDEEGA